MLSCCCCADGSGAGPRAIVVPSMPSAASGPPKRNASPQLTPVPRMPLEGAAPAAVVSEVPLGSAPVEPPSILASAAVPPPVPTAGVWRSAVGISMDSGAASYGVPAIGNSPYGPTPVGSNSLAISPGINPGVALDASGNTLPPLAAAAVG